MFLTPVTHARFAVILSLCSVALAPRVSRADRVADCITLLNRLSSAINTTEHWRDDVSVAALADNGKVIDKVTNDFKRARSAYDEAMACANSEEARRSKSYAKARERFARDFPRFQKSLQKAREGVKEFSAALDITNDMRDVINGLLKADAANYDREVEQAEEKLSDALKKASTNGFLNTEWERDMRSGVHNNLTALKRKKAGLDKAATREKILANTVVNKLSGFTRDDAIDPRKIAQALEKMPLDAYVVLPMGESRVFHRYTPTQVSHPKNSTLEMRYPGDRKPNTPAFVFYNQRVIFVRYQKDELPKMNAPIVGVVWEVIDDQNVVFVSASGGRYLTHINHVIAASEAATPLSAQIINGMLIHEDIKELSKQGVINARYGREMTKAKEAYEACAKKVWKANEKAFNRIEMADLLPETRRNRRMDLDGKVRSNIDRKCTSHQRKYASTWNKAMQEYTKLRGKAVRASANRVADLAH